MTETNRRQIDYEQDFDPLKERCKTLPALPLKASGLVSEIVSKGFIREVDALAGRVAEKANPHK